MHAKSIILGLSICGLGGCDDGPSRWELVASPPLVLVRLHGDGQDGHICEAQSDCGWMKQCAYRGTKSGDRLGKNPLYVQNGLCEPQTWPAGYFALLPQHRMSDSEKDNLKQQGHDGLPAHILCH